MSKNTVVIGENAKRARETNGFSQANVADFLNVDQSLISKFEKGDRNLQSDMLERLANLYGYRVSDFEYEGGVPERRMKAAYRSKVNSLIKNPQFANVNPPRFFTKNVTKYLLHYCERQQILIIECQTVRPIRAGDPFLH